jgi:RimJ/RimL family protein N-acetyltransferase
VPARPSGLRSRWAGAVAYLFGPADWGQGYATEALAWLHRYLRLEHGVVEFWATVAPTNERSKRVLLRSGYRAVSQSDARTLGSYNAGDEVFRCDHANALAAMWARGE